MRSTSNKMIAIRCDSFLVTTFYFISTDNFFPHAPWQTINVMVVHIMDTHQDDFSHHQKRDSTHRHHLSSKLIENHRVECICSQIPQNDITFLFSLYRVNWTVFFKNHFGSMSEKFTVYLLKIAKYKCFLYERTLNISCNM